MNRFRVEKMELSIFAVLVLPTSIQNLAVDITFGKGLTVARQTFFRDDIQAYTTNPRRSPGEIAIDHFLTQSYCLKDLGAAIALNG
ncbi:hypothetical protein HRbin36_00915 [bacterium HR36]|nr:hypothetical protein HRbin36_00915 [bacterium HR36]